MLRNSDAKNNQADHRRIIKQNKLNNNTISR